MTDLPNNQKEINDSGNRAKKANLQAQIESAKLVGVKAVESMIAIVHQSSLDPQEKIDLITEAVAALLEAENKEKVATKGDAASITEAQTEEQEPLHTAEEVRKRYELSVRSTYKEFDSFHEDLLDKEKALNNLLVIALQELESGGKVGEETRKAVIEAEKQLHGSGYEHKKDNIRKTGEVSANEQSYHAKKLIAIERAIQTGDSNLSTAELVKAREVHRECLAESYAKINQVKEHEEAQKQYASLIEQGSNKVQAKGSIRGKEFWGERTKGYKGFLSKSSSKAQNSDITGSLNADTKAKLEEIKSTMQQHTTSDKASSSAINKKIKKAPKGKGRDDI